MCPIGPPDPAPCETWRRQQCLAPLTAEQQQLALSCVPLAVKLASRFACYLGDEAVSISFLHLCRAAALYDKGRAGKFSTAAWAYCLNGLKKAINERNAKTRGAGVTHHQISALARDDSDLWEPADASPTHDEGHDAEEIELLLEPLTEREREVVRLRASGLSLAEIGKRFRRSKERVRQILCEAGVKILAWRGKR